MTKDYVTATSIIRNEGKYDEEKYEYIPFDTDFRDKAFAAFKSFVASSARGKRRERIMQSGYYNVNDWGILRRLWYYPETNKVYYCCGQDWNTEMAILRDAFDWQ